MDPNQQDNSSDVSADTPAPEVTPTPDTTLAPEPTPELVPEPTPLEPPVDNSAQSDAPDQPIDTAQPVEQPVPESTPASTIPDAAPVTPAFPAQPAVSGGTTSPATGVPINTPPKSKKGLVIGLVAGIGGLVIVGVVVILFLFVFNGGQIKNFAEFKDAIENRKAMNCDATISQSGMSIRITIQADDGWDHVHASAPSMMDMEIWGVKEGDKYATYASVSGQASKSTQSIDDFNDQSESTFGGSDGFSEDTIELDCKPNNQADFTIPSDIDFKETD